MLVAFATGDESLDSVVDVIHDRPFRVEDVRADPTRGVVSVRFRGATHHAATLASRFRPRLDEVMSGPEVVLEVHNVLRWMLHECEGVGTYDFNTLHYDPLKGELQVLTGIPLDFTIWVSGFDVSVYAGNDRSD